MKTAIALAALLSMPVAFAETAAPAGPPAATPSGEPAKPPHPVCKDEKSASDYASKWSNDLTEAAKAGTVTAEQAMKASQDLQDFAAKAGNSTDFSAFCYKLDELRAEMKF